MRPPDTPNQKTFYASTTRGFEEIGVATLTAVNRDEAVAAQLTKQIGQPNR